MHSRFEASIPNMNKQGVMETECFIDPSGHVTYEMKSYEGDSTIKKEVIARYISGVQESSASNASSIAAVSIQPQNYRFKYKKADSVNDKAVEVFEVVPRRSAIGLFKGEIWLDADLGLPRRMRGRFVRNPSVVFKAVDFTQEFVIDGDHYFESLRTIESTTRIVGKVNMTIKSSGHKLEALQKETKLTSRASQR